MAQKHNILIVEDEIIVAKDIERCLIKTGYNVIGIASDSTKALSLLSQNEPSLILMDIHIRGELDGISLHEKIKELYAIPVIYLTAYSDEPTKKRVMKTEPMGYLLKPFNEDELLTSIELALHKFSVEKKLLAYERFQKTMLNSIGEGVITTNAEHEITFSNPVAQALTNTPLQKATGSHVFDVLKITTMGGNAIREFAMFSNQPLSEEFDLWYSPDQSIPIELTATPIQDTDKRIQGYAFVFHDISERRKAEADLQKKLKLEQAFLAISHEFINKETPNLQSIISLLGNSLNVNRSYIFLVDDDKQHISNVYEWTDEETEPQIQTLQHIPITEFPFSWEKLTNDRYVLINDLSQNNSLSVHERELLERQDIKSIILAPLKIDSDEIIGFMGFDDTVNPRMWNDDEIRSLRITTEMINNYLGRKHAEKALLESEERFRSLIQHSTDLISVVNFHGKLVYQSPSVKHILGFSASEIENHLLIEFIHPDDRELIIGSFFDFIKNPQNENFKAELRLKKKNEDWIYVESYGRIYSVNQRPLGVIFNSRDITDRVLAEKELREAKNKAEEMNRLKTTFLANMSHEIRTPLTGILGFASILEQELKDEEYQVMAERIQTSGLRLLETIDAILDLSKIEANKLDAELTYLDITKEVETAIYLLQPLAKRKNLEVKLVEVSQTFASFLDKNLLGQILNNLIGNAIKYTEEGSVTVRVGSLHKALSPINFIEIEDTGIGISPEFLPRIFDEFKQESQGLSRKFEGSGLGLTITQKLVEHLGGQISVQSEQGKGSIVTVTFPGYLREKLEKSPVASVPVNENQSISEIKPKLLIVDDNEDSLQVYAFFLKEQYDVTLAATGEEAISLIDKKKFDLILMDINLGPGMDGVETFRVIRDQIPASHLPIIAVTAYAMKGDDKKLLNYGFNGYVSKPFQKQTLLKMVADNITIRKNHGRT